MTPSRSVRRDRPPSSGAISTGTIAPLSTTAFGNSCRRYLNSWLLFTSWRRATIDTDAPGSSVSATIWRFNALEYSRRFVGPGCCVNISIHSALNQASDLALPGERLHVKRVSVSAYDRRQ
jgi:hypothetical protein